MDLPKEKANPAPAPALIGLVRMIVLLAVALPAQDAVQVPRHISRNGGDPKMGEVHADSPVFREAVADGVFVFRTDDIVPMGPVTETWRNRASNTAVIFVRTNRLPKLRYDSGSEVSTEMVWEHLWQNKLTYASVQGYDAYKFDVEYFRKASYSPKLQSSRPDGWAKVAILRQCQDYYDYCVWFDEFSIVADLSIRVESLFRSGRDAVVAARMTADAGGGIYPMVAIRKGTTSAKLTDAWWASVESADDMTGLKRVMEVWSGKGSAWLDEDRVLIADEWVSQAALPKYLLYYNCSGWNTGLDTCFRDIVELAKFSANQVFDIMKTVAQESLTPCHRAVRQAFKDILGRYPDPEGLNHYCEKFCGAHKSDAYPLMASDLCHSEEYASSGRDVGYCTTVSRLIAKIQLDRSGAAGIRPLWALQLVAMIVTLMGRRWW